MPLSSKPGRPEFRSLPRGRLAAARAIPASLLMVIRIRMYLTLSSLTRLRKRLLPAAEPHDIGDLVAVGRVAWSVRIVSRFVPFASCLTQAQACQVLLARRGIASTLCLGVGGQGGRHMRAHAWLMCDGKVVIGGESEDLRQFRPLTELGSAR